MGKPKKRYYKRRKKGLTLSEDGNKFHSKFERDCYELIKEYLPNTKLDLQKSYPKHVKYNKIEKKTCDFYFEYNNTPIWLEVSSYKSKRTDYRTEMKRRIISQYYPTNIFLFLDSLKKLKDILKQTNS